MISTCSFLAMSSQELQMEISRLRGENAQLLERVAMLEAELDALGKSHALALDAEIATYRRLLMGEETWLREHAGGELQMSGGGGGGGGFSMSGGGGGGGGGMIMQ